MQQTLDTFKKKQQDIQENLKKLEGKKDKDAKPIMETLYEQLMETEQLYQQVWTNTNVSLPAILYIYSITIDT